MNQLTRGQLGKRCGVNRETIRYYERMGLLFVSDHSPSGYCLFPETAVERICFIKRAQSVGFSLEQIKTLLELQTQIDMPIGTVITSQIVEIDLKIQALESMRALLLTLI